MEATSDITRSIEAQYETLPSSDIWISLREAMHNRRGARTNERRFTILYKTLIYNGKSDIQDDAMNNKRTHLLSQCIPH